MRIVKLVTLILVALAPVCRADEPITCVMCAGLEVEVGAETPASIPLLVRVPQSRLAEATRWATALEEDVRKQMTVVIEIEETIETIERAEEIVSAIASGLDETGTFQAAGVRLPDSNARIEAYMLRRLAVLFQGRQVATEIVIDITSSDDLEDLAREGASPYFDLVLVDESQTDAARTWIIDNDPTKRLLVTVEARDASPIYDIARGFAPVVRQAYREASDTGAFLAVEAFNRALEGDYSVDPTSGARLLDGTGTRELEGEPIVLVRGEDLRTLIIPPANGSETRIVALSDGGYVSTTRFTSSGIEPYRDTGRNGGNFLIGVPSSGGWLFFALDRPSFEEMEDVVAEKIDVRDTRGITVEEIIRKHQAYWAWQQSITPRYIARNQTDLRFSIGPTAERFEVSIAGPQFFDGERLTDWLWEEFFVNGVRWRYGKFPELPIVQSEKVTQLPLAINLTNEYRYQLGGDAQIGPFDTWEVRFTPPADAPDDLPLYRGTVWIDKRTFARVRIRKIQLNLKGDVLSNEELTDYMTFDASTSSRVERDAAAGMAPRSILWLPESISMQMVVSTITRPLAVERRTSFSEFRLQPVDFTEQYERASESEKRMVRDTEEGLRYLVEDESGERVVKQGFDTSQLFLLGGVRADEGTDPPVLPLAGVDYFDWNLFDKGIQTNIFFAGVILAASVSNSSVGDSGYAVGADLFGLAIPFKNSIYRDGEESEGEGVDVQPFALNSIVSRQLGSFINVSASVSTTYLRFSDSDETDEDFLVPSDTWVITPALEIDYNRWGYSFDAGYEWGTRTTWTPWGRPEEYDERQKDFQKWGVTVSKTFFFPAFQRLGIEFGYLDGENLDRFSKYELGQFGTARVRGIRSESVRAESAILGHASYGLVLSDFLRVEAFYDAASIDDRASGFDGEIFQGVGIGGQTIGPWGTIIRFDLGMSVGANRQDGVVGTILFLKIYD